MTRPQHRELFALLFSISVSKDYVSSQKKASRLQFSSYFSWPMLVIIYFGKRKHNKPKTNPKLLITAYIKISRNLGSYFWQFFSNLFGIQCSRILRVQSGQAYTQPSHESTRICPTRSPLLHIMPANRESATVKHWRLPLIFNMTY